MIFFIEIGVNLPDHESLFGLLASNLEESHPPVVVATLFSDDFTSVKNAVINMVSQLLNTIDVDDDSDVRKCFFNYSIIFCNTLFQKSIGFQLDEMDDNFIKTSIINFEYNQLKLLAY